MKTKKLTLKLLAIVLGLGSMALSAHADELYKPKHGGVLLQHKKTGLAYEVVRKPKEVQVYAPTESAYVPKEITVHFKNGQGTFDQVHLKLLPPNEPGSLFYSAPLPEGVLISAGVTFDFD